ncbi:DUF2062 domain-containing protein [Sphingomonas radiodurans]|uniref:DUF2062 domain-containing protein n=1 Tax=Sphingomonas radiodurans TaxID=2890321 RepID=UPI001E289E12|nr:DUF2062 domain-containing protein [Sphingomonas radiodurans]WBH16392.1 DUF2062 domain-containing protein [Sphingomonas radiodurans]
MATRPPTFWQRVAGWCHRNLPTRESMQESRMLRPVAHRVLAPALWRFTRRSVPRGVALGMVTGILFPVAQIPFSALLALPVRANIPAAALTTFITNPLTTPPLWVAAYYIGKWMLRLDQALPGDPVSQAANGAAQSNWMQWLMSDAAPATALGLLIVTAVLSSAGYGLSVLGWRLWIARKWRHRHNRNHVDDAS